ncbi:TPA: N-acetyltransferase [Candidatus Poribacteria bacterium]|nr:N-acetyltransferase [Candidatus Poribacteria bacterium]
MYTKLSNVKLKSGEDMEIGVVLAPDQEHSEAIVKVLHHKGEPWLTHVNKALDGTITDLETRFYIGKLNGQVVANIMTVEYNHTGILGHVFTIPEQRRKHICTLIMEQQMNDFKRRGGVLLLGTGFDSAPYWIYHSFGFRSVLENSGFMRFSTDDNFEEKHFTYGKVKAVDVQWKHWPLMAVLMSVKETEILKSVSSGLYGIVNFEGGFLNFMKRLEDGNIKAKVLESESGAVVGCITLEQDHRWAGKTYILDMFMHKNFIVNYDDLINSMELPEGKIQCFIMANSPDEKINALKKSGFEQEALLKNQFFWDNKRFDVCLFSKFVVA